MAPETGTGAAALAAPVALRGVLEMGSLTGASIDGHASVRQQLFEQQWTGPVAHFVADSSEFVRADSLDHA